MLPLAWLEDRATLASDLSAVPGAKTKVGGGRALVTLSPPSGREVSLTYDRGRLVAVV